MLILLLAKFPFAKADIEQPLVAEEWLLLGNSISPDSNNFIGAVTCFCADKLIPVSKVAAPLEPDGMVVVFAKLVKLTHAKVIVNSGSEGTLSMNVFVPIEVFSKVYKNSLILQVFNGEKIIGEQNNDRTD